MPGEDDDISVTSTAPSEQLSEYEVETILAERQFDHDTMYLVKWAGYPIERCTWEPADSFLNDESFADWEKKKKAIAEGRRPDFDLERWQKHLLALEEARDQRKRRREAKRKRLGFSRAQTGASKKQRVDANPSSSEPSHPSSSTHAPLPAPAKGPARTHSPNRPPVVSHLPPKPTMVMSGSMQNRQGPWMAARHKRPIDSEGAPKQFSLATKWRHEKAKGSEPPPNTSQLELARPSEWPPLMGNSPSTPKIGNHLVSSPKTDSPLPSPQEKSNSAWTNDDSELPYQNRFSNSDTWKPALLQSRKSWGPEKPLGDSWKPTRITKVSTWRPDYEIPGDARRDNSSESRTEDSQHSSQFNVDHGRPETRFAVQSGPQKASPQVPSDKEAIPPLPPRRPITIKGAHNRRARDDNFQSRFWNLGELFCYMYFGPDKKPIGPVRLCGLDNITRSKILMSKQGRRIEIWFQDTCTLGEYRDLCSRAPFNARYGNGWIEGFDDTEPEVYKTGQELRRGNCLAISYPDDNTPRNVLVASSPFSSDFDFLRDNFTSSQETFIYLTARSPLARLDRSSLFERVSRPRIPTATQEPATPLDHSFPVPVEHRVGQKSPKPTHSDQSPPLLPADDSSLDTQDFDAGQNYVHDQGETKEQVMSPEQLLSDKHEPLKCAQLQKAPAKQLEQDKVAGITGLTPGAELPAKTHELSVENFDVDTFFKDVFKMSFDILSTTNGVKAGSEVFYLMCPTQEPTVQDERGVVVEFLKKNRAVIFSNRLEEDWERFVRTINRGVVLFHESFVNYDEMPDLKILIHKPFTFWSFSLTGVGDDHNKTYFQRLFPHGGAILLTEDFMLNEPDATVIVLSWFNEWTKKKFPGSWKIMLRPNVLDWLLRQPEPKEEPRNGIWLAMYSLIVQLSTVPDVVSTHSPEPIPSDGIYDEFSETRVISPRQIPFYGLRTEDDCVGFGLPKGLTQEQRNTDHLAEFFAGWALINSQRFRRFFVLTTLKPLDRWKRWNHVGVIGSAAEFFRLHGIDWRVYWRKVRPGPKPSEAAASGDRRQSELNVNANSTVSPTIARPTNGLPSGPRATPQSMFKP